MGDELGRIIPSITARVLFEGALRRSLPAQRREITQYIRAFLETYFRYCELPLDIEALYRFMTQNRTCCEFQAVWIKQNIELLVRS